MIKLVAFDWNGTLLADACVHIKAQNAICKAYRLKKLTLARSRKTFQIPIVEHWTKNGFTREFFLGHVKEVNDIFTKEYGPRADKCRSRKGARELLGKLHQQKIQSVIFSNHAREDIERQVKRLKIDRHFAYVLAREPGDISHSRKRKKEKKLIGLVKSLKFRPHEVLTIGDTGEEIEIGKKHGYVTVGITGGYSSTKRIKEHQPDYLIHNLKELIGIIRKLNKK